MSSFLLWHCEYVKCWFVFDYLSSAMKIWVASTRTSRVLKRESKPPGGEDFTQLIIVVTPHSLVVNCGILSS